MIIQSLLAKTSSLNCLNINQNIQILYVPNENLNRAVPMRNIMFPYFLAKNCSLFNLTTQNYKPQYFF